MANFDFFPSIPATNNDPSSDQPNMQTNNQSINDWSAVDHVGYNTVDGGTHKQVTFSSNNTPSLPTTFPTFFTDITTGLAQPRFYSGSAAQTSSQYVPTVSPGSTFALGGILIKWGTVSIAGSTSSQVVSYVSAFINATLSVVLTATNQNGAGRTVYISATSSSGFTVSVVNANTQPITYNYIAIGY